MRTESGGYRRDHLRARPARRSRCERSSHHGVEKRAPAHARRCIKRKNGRFWRSQFCTEVAATSREGERDLPANPIAQLGSAARPQPSGLNTRTVEAGLLASLEGGRNGRDTRLPAQLGQRPPSLFSAQSRQNVHSNVQIIASVAAGGKSLLQHSQLGRSSSMPSSYPDNRVCTSDFRPSQQHWREGLPPRRNFRLTRSPVDHTQSAPPIFRILRHAWSMIVIGTNQVCFSRYAESSLTAPASSVARSSEARTRSCGGCARCLQIRRRKATRQTGLGRTW